MLYAQIQRISYRMDEIKFIRSIIEKDAVVEFNGMIDRSRCCEGQKTAVLQNEMAQLQKEIGRIDQIVGEYAKIRDDEAEMMLRARALKETVESIMTRPFKKEIDVTPEDLPRELTNLRAILHRASAMPALLKIKNEIIYQLHQDETGIHKNAVSNFNQMASKELESWSQYLSQTQADVKQFQLICYYCAETLNDNSINGQCYLNKKKLSDKDKRDKGFTGFTKKHPKDKFFGNGQHYFSEPLQNIFTDGIAFNNLQA
jgi:hypothetical protein